MRQLDYESAGDGEPFRQLDALVGAAFAYLLHEPTRTCRACSSIRSVRSTSRRAATRSNGLIEQIAQRLHPEVDDAYARRLLAVPFAATTAQRRASLAWLRGAGARAGAARPPRRDRGPVRGAHRPGPARRSPSSRRAGAPI